MRAWLATKIILISILMMLVSINSINGIQAASFDCSKAKFFKEILICSDEELSETEELLDKEYKEALREYSDKEELRNNQQKWLDDLNRRVEDDNRVEDYMWCHNVECLLTEYNKRIDLIRTRYSTFVYAIYNYTGEYYKDTDDERKSGIISVQPMSDNTIKFKVILKYRPEAAADAYVCNIGEHGGVIAKFIDKTRAVFLDYDKDCLIVLRFDRNRLTVSHYMGCADYCGQDTDHYGKQYWGVRMEGVYVKKK